MIEVGWKSSRPTFSDFSIIHLWNSASSSRTFIRWNSYRIEDLFILFYFTIQVSGQLTAYAHLDHPLMGSRIKDRAKLHMRTLIPKELIAPKRF